MSNVGTEYEALAKRAKAQHAETGKVDPKLRADKAAAFNAMVNEQRQSRKREKRTLQESYVRRFPKEVQTSVRIWIRHV